MNLIQGGHMKQGVIAGMTFLMLIGMLFLVCTQEGKNSTGSPFAHSPFETLDFLCDSNCTRDTSSIYVMIRHDSTAVITATNSTVTILDFIQFDESRAVTSFDTGSVAGFASGTISLIYQRMSGTAVSVENGWWRLDSITLNVPLLSMSNSLAVPTESFIFLDSSNNRVYTAGDTAALTAAVTTLLSSAIALCPKPFLSAMTSIQGASLLLPVDSVDTVRSTCDTTWGTKSLLSQTSSRYVVSNNRDSLFTYNASTHVLVSAMDIKKTIAVIESILNSGLVKKQ
jgi:hypothetical protein